MNNDIITAHGIVEILKQDAESGSVVERVVRNNTVLLGGRASLIAALKDGSSGASKVAYMRFGVGGEEGGVPRIVSPSRTTLFGAAGSLLAVNSPSYSALYPDQVTFTSIVNKDTLNGNSLNEAALVLEDQTTLFSMITFPGMSKTSSIQFTLNWTIVLAG